MESFSIWVAFGAGILSFVSPCNLPLYPAYLSYITGTSVRELQEKKRSFKNRTNMIFHTLFFILGFSIIFYVLGFSFTWMGQFFKDFQDVIRMLGSVLIIAMGLMIIGVFKPKVLIQEKRIQIPVISSLGYFRSLLIGIGFAAGWTPCIGPVLASVLTLSATNPDKGLSYITAFTLGFAIPFFILTFFISKARWIVKYSEQVMKIGGFIMIGVGVLLYFDQMTMIVVWLTRFYGGFTGF
jgi:cytochrome c-type biogenesis protein